MKLDRNINPNGRGKYALINMRTSKVEWGGHGDEQFFVIKYKDRFAPAALAAYAKACKDYAENCGDPVNYREYMEFADQVNGEALVAAQSPTKQLPS